MEDKFNYMRVWVWRLFYLQLVTTVIAIVCLYFDIQLIRTFPYDVFVLGIPVLLTFLHSIYTLGSRRGSLFLFLAMFVGWVMETLGLRDGTIFGGRYLYSDEFLTIQTVPLAVVLYWAVFIYISYTITTSFLYWRKVDKPSKNGKGLYVLLCTILLDAWIVTAIDLFMDPIQVAGGYWTWLTKGAYFGVPIGNFVGWFLTSIIVTGLFRTLEYYYPVKEPKRVKTHYLIPVFEYLFLALSFSMSAIMMDMLDLLITGSIFMFPVIIINLISYRKYLKLAKNTT